MTRILTRLKADKQQKSKDAVLLEKVTRWIGEGAENCALVHERCEKNNMFVAGDIQWSEGDARRQQDRERPAMPMNKTIQVVNAVANREIMNRYVPKVNARSRDDSGWSEVQDEFLRWQRDMSEAEHEESMAFRSLTTSGYATVHTYFDPLEDEGNGTIMIEEIPMWGMLWDSRARKQNLVDRRWHIHGKYVSRDEAEEEYGSVSPAARKMFKSFERNVIDENERLTGGSGNSPGRWSWDSISSGRWYNRAEEEIFLVEAEWRDVTTEYRAAVPTRLEEFIALQSDPLAVYDFGMDEMGQPMGQLDGETYAGLEPEMQIQIRDMVLSETKIQIFKTLKELEAFSSTFFDATDIDFEDYAKQKRYSYHYGVFCNNVVLETGDRPQGFTYEFLTGFPKATREGTEFFGLVDIAKGPQDWRNTLMSLVLTRLATSPKAPFIVESDAVEDMNDFLNQVANPRSPIIVQPGFVNSKKWMELEPPTFPPLERELMQMADQGIGEAAGLSGLDLGQQSDLRRISGTVVQSVKEASNTILALLFDALRRYRKRSAKLVLKYMYQFYDADEIARIVGPEKEQWVLEKELWPDANRFDIKVDEAPTSSTERMELFDFLTRTNTLESWTAQGLLPIDLIMEWVPFISEADRRRIKEHQEMTQVQAQAQAQLDSVMGYLQQTPEGQALLQQMQEGGVVPPPADPATQQMAPPQ